MADDLHPLAQVPIIEITIDDTSTRKDYGDLAGLAESIGNLGLFHPILLDANNNILAGQRRYLAVKDVLGWETIPAFIVDLDKLQVEYDENELRKDFTVSERVEIARRLKNRFGNRQGERTDQLPEKIPEVGSGEETREAAARISGFGNERTLRQAEQVLANGTPELVTAMDSGEMSISAAADASVLPPETQKSVVEQVRAGKKPRKAVNEAKEGKTSAPKEKKKPAEQEEVFDRTGAKVPPTLRDAFADTAIPEQAEKIKSWLESLQPKAVGNQISRRMRFYPYLSAAKVQKDIEEAAALLQAALEHIESNLPHAICPGCKGSGKKRGKDCTSCRCGCGYVPRWRYDELTRLPAEEEGEQ